MHHELPLADLGPRHQSIADAVQACVHCGFCLPNCPTYQVIEQEQDSPRGRILLMKEVLEGKLPEDEARVHIDRCLGCLSCETSCPSGVRYGDLLSSYRALHPGGRTGIARRLVQGIALSTLPYPARFRAAVRIGRWAKPLSRLVPRPLRPMVDLVPDSLPQASRLQAVHSARGRRQLRVGLLAGCAQSVLAPEISAAAIRLLTRHGVEVVVPRNQGCCGALAWHVGAEKQAVRMARHNLEAFPADLDYVVTTAAGCGSACREYALVLAGTEHEPAAQAFAKRSIDISALLAQLPLQPIPPLERSLRIAYHDACHLAHAQRVVDPPRRLLRQIPGAELVPIRDAEICCGSAGTYNIEQPEIAAELGRRKAESVRETDCDLVALGNIGCQIQIRRYLEQIGFVRPVLHTVEILDRAYENQLGVGRATTAASDS